ncbi:MAG: T9SS type A sorting domain-containing protein [Ignavibacteriae bacterium]|nr:T9SS type A sorting domain-containing protein [Ignavibacteriota bacterium]
MNQYVLNYANPYIDFTRYDNWTPNGNDWIWGGDGTAEMIIIHYRFIPHNGDLPPPDGHGGWFWPQAWGGIASLGISPPISLDGISIGSDNGVTALGGLNRLTKTQTIVEHEICHVLGLNHYTTGLMTPGNSESSYILNPNERGCLGYGNVTQVSYSQSYQDYILKDYVETGDALMIGTYVTSDKFWITNNQKKSVYDGLSRGSSACWSINRCEQDPYCSIGKGLYVYHQWGTLTIPIRMDLKSSDGFWSWELDRYANVPLLGGNTPLMKKSIWNPFYGTEKFHQKYLNSNYWSPQTITDDACSEDPNGVSITQDYHGSGYDGFNKGYDEIFSPYSNPNSYSFDPITNTGITLRIIDQNQAGDITVRVYYNDEEALADSPPSKPKGLQHDYYYPNGGWCVPKITWHHNMEPDMLRGDGTKRYQIWRATAPNMNGCPNFNWTYSMIYQGDFSTTYDPEYIDNSILEYDCALLDQVPPFGTKYPVSYKIKAVDASLPVNKISVYSDSVFTTGITNDGGMQEGAGGDNFGNINNIPKDFRLSQNYPNPFNPVTNIKYDLPKDVMVNIKVYDLLGKEIKTLVNEFKQAGSYLVSFNGSEFASGIYFYRIQAGSFTQVKRMVLIK